MTMLIPQWEKRGDRLYKLEVAGHQLRLRSPRPDCWSGVVLNDSGTNYVTHWVSSFDNRLIETGEYETMEEAAEELIELFGRFLVESAMVLRQVRRP